MRTIKIDNRDLSYTIDTYGMFTGESVHEMEANHYRDEYNLTDDEWRDLDFDYDMAAITKALALESINIIWGEIPADIITNIDLIDTDSPRFYNYATDHYTADWTLDDAAMLEYIREHRDEFAKFAADEWPDLHAYDLDADDCIEAGDLIVAMIDYYTREHLDADSYNMAMFERETEVYMEHMTLAPESQALIDERAAAREAATTPLADADTITGRGV